MSNKIRKAVIPAAGFGTRFLPISKSVPKEMLPIIDKPIIQYVVEEVIDAGIKEIIIVTTKDKVAIKDYFQPSPKLEKHLRAAGKHQALKLVQKLTKGIKFTFVNQVGPYGNGTPVLCAEKHVGNEPFVVVWGDEFIHASPLRLQQMVKVYSKYQKPLISAIRIKNKKDLSRYGIAKVKKIKGNVYQILGIHEKPAPDKAPSNLATHGAYILPPKIFTLLKNTKPGAKDEIWLADALNQLIATDTVYACEIKNAKYYDAGNKLEYLKTNIDFALKHPEIGKSFKKYIKQL